MKLLPRRSLSSCRPFIAFILAVVALSGIIGHRFYNEPRLTVGTLAPQTIHAPAPARVEDTQTTQSQREVARREVLPALMIDQEATQRITQDLESQLDEGQELRQLAGSFPFVLPSILSTATQLYLRSAPQLEWQMILTALQAGQSSTNPQPLGSVGGQRFLLELQTYRVSTSAPEVQLVDKIVRARQRYQQALKQLVKFPAFDTSLLNLTNQDWQIVKQETLRASERMLAQGIAPGLPPETLETAVALNLSALPLAVQSLATQLLLNQLQPNLVVDRATTYRQAEQAVQNTQRSFLSVEPGEIIVRSGQPISHKAFVLLDHFDLTRRGVHWLELLGTGGLVIITFGVFWLVKNWSKAPLVQRDYILLLTLAMTVYLSAWVASVEYTSLPAVGLLTGSFYGSTIGLTMVGLLAVLLPLEADANWLELLPIIASSLVAAGMAGRLRSREELALLGGGIALVQGVSYLILNSVTGLVWYGLLKAAAWCSLLGLSWSVVALGISPYLEHLFDLLTPIRLAELANHNRPMLKRLAVEAPGTFQHTLLVATLAEAAARALNCNVELVRTGTLYHDIGKLHDPQSFIENQLGGPNKHDEINDPWRSAAVIKKHVTEGLIMARKCRLPKAVKAFIPEHQGTLLIAYFYHEAQKRTGRATVDEADFRYDGPVPQSRETAIVMLADACEAALRSLQEVKPEDALLTVNKIFKARWQDGQLVDSGLSRQEVSQVAEVFIQVWQQFNHQRIRYPATTPAVKGS